MTRRSKREIEHALDELGTTEGDDPSFDVREHVSASFGTYREDGNPLDEADVPDDWTVSTTSAGDDAVYRVLEREASSDGGRSR